MLDACLMHGFYTLQERKESIDDLLLVKILLAKRATSHLYLLLKTGLLFIVNYSLIENCSPEQDLVLELGMQSSLLAEIVIAV